MGFQDAGSTGSVVEVELEVRDRECFFVRASARAECRFFLEEFIHRGDDPLLEFATVRDVAVKRVLRMVDDAPSIADARLVREGSDGGLFEFVVAGSCVVATLAETGAIAQAVSATDGEGRVVATVPPHVDVGRVVETFRRRHPDSTLVARRHGDESIPVRTEAGIPVALADKLTDKQLEALETAFLRGYFDWPRDSTADECADALGVAQPTFSQHLRAAQYKLFATLFGSESPGVERA